MEAHPQAYFLHGLPVDYWGGGTSRWFSDAIKDDIGRDLLAKKGIYPVMLPVSSQIQ